MHIGIVFLKYTEPFADPLTRRLFEGIHEVLREHGAVVTTYGLTCVQGDDYDALVRDLVEMDFDAVIIAPEATERALRILGESMTVFQVGYHLPVDEWNFVAGDLESGIRQAVRELFELGHLSMAFMSTLQQSDSGKLGVPQAKVRAFEMAVQEVGSGRIEASVVWQSDRDAFFGSQQRPTALITAQTGQAKAVLARASELGISIPRDMSLISFDDGEIGETTMPKFSGIQVLSEEMGRRCGKVVADLVKGYQTLPVQQLLKPKLIMRETCAEAPKR